MTQSIPHLAPKLVLGFRASPRLLKLWFSTSNSPTEEEENARWCAGLPVRRFPCNQHLVSNQEYCACTLTWSSHWNTVKNEPCISYIGMLFWSVWLQYNNYFGHPTIDGHDDWVWYKIMSVIRLYIWLQSPSFWFILGSFSLAFKPSRDFSGT